MTEIQPCVLPMENLDGRNWVPILLNRTAGPRFRLSLYQSTLEKLTSYGLMPEPFESEQELSNAVAQNNHKLRCIAAGGGDGTILRIVNRFPNHNIAVLPLGSQNLLASQLGIAMTAESISNAIFAPNIRILDVGRVNNKICTLMASIGFDAEVVRKVHENRKGHVSKWDYIRVALSDWISVPQRSMILKVDDHEPIDACMAFFFNLPAYALGIPLCPHADAEDGKLNLVAFRRTGRIRMMTDVASILQRAHLRRDDVVNIPFERISISSEVPISIQCDGDFVGTTPCSIEVAPKAVRFFANRGVST